MSKNIYNNIVSLTYNSLLSSFSFLAAEEARMQKLNEKIVESTKSQHMLRYYNSIRKQNVLLKQIKPQNLNNKILSQLSPATQNKIFKKNYEKIKELQEYMKNIIKNVPEYIDAQKITPWISSCSRLNIIDIRVWHKLLFSLCKNYHLLDRLSQKQCLGGVQFYLYNSFPRRQYIPSKFVYPQTYIADLIITKSIIYESLKCINVGNNVFQNEIQTKKLKYIILIIQKIKKTSVINLHQLIQIYKQKQEILFQLAQTSNTLQYFLQIMKFLSLVGLREQQRLQKIQKKIMSFFLEKQNQNEQPQRSKIYQIVQCWGNLSYHNPKLFKKIIKPFILKDIKQIQKRRSMISVFFNLLNTRLQDIHFFETLYSQCQKLDNIQKNRYFHTISHFLSVLKKNKYLSSYPFCLSSSSVIKYIDKPYSSCMEQPKINFKKTQQIIFQAKQQHITENYWLSALQKVYEILNKQFPDQNNIFEKKCKICIYQMDCFIVIKNIKLAIQFIGTHYTLKDIDMQRDQTKQGRKYIRNTIIKGYGIKIIQFSSISIIQRNLTSFRDNEGAVKYLYQALLKEIKQ